MGQNMKIRAIVGVPGAGKTRKVAEEVTDFVQKQDLTGLAKGEGPPVVMSYTRAAAEEIASRITGLSEGKRAGTVHSFAFRSLRDVLDGFETRGVANKDAELLTDFNASVRSSYRLKGGTNTSDPYGASRGSPGDELLQEADRLRHTCTPLADFPPQVAQFHEVWTAFKLERDSYDFTDLIQIAIEESHYCPGKPEAIWVDECQDMTPLMLRLVRKWAAHNSCGQLTIVGDPAQAIFCWAGADPTIFDSPKIGETVALDKSWRTPRAIHAVAEPWIEQLTSHTVIKYTPADRDGSVSYLQSSYKAPTRVIDRVEDNASKGLTTMIQASCTFMLAATMVELRARGIPYANPWAKNNGLFNPLPHGSPKRTTIVDRILALLDFEGGNWRIDSLKKWAGVLSTDRTGGPLKWGSKKKIEACEDEGWVTAEHIDAWFSDYAILEAGIREDAAGTLRAWLGALRPEVHRRSLFPVEIALRGGSGALREPPGCYVGTIHSFKGSEADETIIYPDLSISGRREWERLTTRDSVIRMGYVAMTRARESLVVCERAHSPKHGAMPLTRFFPAGAVV